MKKSNLVLGAALLSQSLLSCAHKEMTPQTSLAPDSPLASTREPSSESTWTTWSDKMTDVAGLAVLSGIRSNLLENNLHDPHVAYMGYLNNRVCNNGDLRYRSADGTCNDIKMPLTGAAGVAFGRNVPTQYIPQNVKLMEPNPSVVSKEFFTRDEFKPVPFLNMLAAVWIQFMNHDWFTHGPNMVGENNQYKFRNAAGEEITVDATAKNPARNGKYNSNYKKVTANDVTHWWDASQIYGSQLSEQQALRTGQDGLMKLDEVNGHSILPRAEGFNPSNNRQNQGQELTGFRDNWWLGLSMLHTLFVKEHNYIATMLKREHVTYDDNNRTWIFDDSSAKRKSKDSSRRLVFNSEAALDEHIFQVSRLINSALLAKIHTVEWTPAILPNKVLRTAMYTNWYGLANPNTWAPSFLKRLIPAGFKTDISGNLDSGYVVGGIVGSSTNNYGTPFSITEEFVSVYRLHSLLPELIELRTLDRPNSVERISFDSARNDKSYDLMARHDPKDLFYSFGVQLPGQLVLNNYPKFMQDLEIPGHPNMDLGMMDVLRDRERGVPRYNQFRKALNLKPLTTYEDFFKKKPNDQLNARQQSIVEKFRKVYGTTNGKDNVDDIDLLVGTLSEEIRPRNFGFGETQFHIFILMASRRLMADRFFTVDYRPEIYTTTGLKHIDEEGSLAQVIVRHMPELADKMPRKRDIVGDGPTTAFYPWRR